jgi:hypothetical protein
MISLPALRSVAGISSVTTSSVMHALAVEDHLAHPLGCR